MIAISLAATGFPDSMLSKKACIFLFPASSVGRELKCLLQLLLLELILETILTAKGSNGLGLQVLGSGLSSSKGGLIASEISNSTLAI